MARIDELFGESVFGDAVMQQRLPKDTYRALKKTIDEGRRLDPQLAAVIAHAMKDWAVEKGVTHYTHWFQPMTGITAEKHDSFVSAKDNGQMILTFSGKELVHGESDASSFPSGGLRSTFEARGYTAWDPTSYAFIKDHVLYIPTAFCSFGGHALDQKTPLLRSMEAINRQAVRILKLFGRLDVTRVIPTVGAEQEYFLIDRKLYHQRHDLIFTGRTLFGAHPPKGQELEDHYYGAIKPRVQAFMNDVNEALWRLGVYAKTEHNEVAPAQHELAPLFTIANIAADHNQLMMEVMKRIAEKHDLVCLFSEKPFDGVNGSGKHNNWSLMTNTGYNLFEPGDSPHESAQFLLFLTAVIKAVDDYQDLLRASVASAGNDHRLGKQEAPPAIMSLFVGDELGEILSALENGTSYEGRNKTEMAIGVHVLPKFPKDNTDRNRTSPFAFTGNKFEFRSLGASASISDANTVLNTIVAESLRCFADELTDAADFKAALHDLIVREIKQHKRILFNGNGYAAAWVKEAEERGLLRLDSTVDALPCLMKEKNTTLFTSHRVFSETELQARCDIKLEGYAKVIHIEAETALCMAQQEILPAAMRYAGEVAAQANALHTAIPGIITHAQDTLLQQLNEHAAALTDGITRLHEAIQATNHQLAPLAQAAYAHNTLLPLMEALRQTADALERITDKKHWPFPTYAELLFGV